MSLKDDNYDVADSTDWLETPFSVLAPVEAALRCQVCKDFYTTPMVTSCSHTFCSLCIRRCLSNDGKCPTCRTSEQEFKLRRNWNIEEAVDAFQKARSVLMGHARTLTATKSPVSPTKRKTLEAEVGTEDDATTRKRTRTSSRLAGKQTETQEALAIDEGEDGDDVDYVPDNVYPTRKCPNLLI